MSTVSIPSPCMLKTTPPSKSSSFIPKPHSLSSTRSISKAFGLKSSLPSRITCMAMYKVKLIDPNGVEKEIEAPDNQCILASADSQGLDLPSSCKKGDCTKCAGKLMFAEVDRSNDSILDDDKKK